jgi:hypothetical protein
MKKSVVTMAIALVLVLWGALTVVVEELLTFVIAMRVLHPRTQTHCCDPPALTYDGRKTAPA